MRMHVALSRGVVAALLFAAGACSAGESGSTGKHGVGLKFSDEATADDVGLPSYPGAKPFKEPGDASSGANVGIDSPVFGLKVAAVELETADQPEQVAAFYRRALSKYGQVLDCSDAANPKREADPEGDELGCDSRESETHRLVYKVGTQKNQRIVAIKPHGNGAQFSLVHVNVRD